MKKAFIFIVFVLLGALINIVLTNKYIHLSVTNATQFDQIEITYKIDDLPLQVKLIKVSPIAVDFYLHPVSFGNHTIVIKCEKLNITETIKVFSINKNYFDFEFQNNNKKAELIIRHSWYPLVYN